MCIKIHDIFNIGFLLYTKIVKKNDFHTLFNNFQYIPCCCILFLNSVAHLVLPSWPSQSHELPISFLPVRSSFLMGFAFIN